MPSLLDDPHDGVWSIGDQKDASGQLKLGDE